MTEHVKETRNPRRPGTAKCLSALCVAILVLVAPVFPVTPTSSAQVRPALAAAQWPVNQNEIDSAVIHFLGHATFGPTFGSAADPTSLAHARAIGIGAWLDEQFNMPALYGDTNYLTMNLVPANPTTDCTAICRRDNYSMYPLQIEFYRNALTGADQLRQRVAFALSQIFVVSAQEATLNKGSWMTPYLQVLDRNAFGNFRTLLEKITLNPAMGRYLNMLGNTKTAPNENYAREVLQLFSIGLNELNLDGSLQLDSRGTPIPTYDQSTVTNFARAFTGWNLANSPGNGLLNYLDPMVVHNESLHDTGTKQLLRYPGAKNGGAVPGGLTAERELEVTLDNIFNHPNVGPFIGKNLIQHLVTSNPSTAYVARVASAFNDNGQGVRGDMQAVIRAILLDPEAVGEADPNFGHLLEPVLFITNVLRAFGVNQATTDFVLGESFLTPGQPVPFTMGEDLFRAPSVFNYYPPGYPLHGTNLKAPEFLLMTTSTAFARINFIYEVVYHRMPVTTDRPKGTWVDLSPFLSAAAGDGSALVEQLNVRLLHGTMSDALRVAVLRGLQNFPNSNPLARVQEAVYLITTSAEYQVGR